LAERRTLTTKELKAKLDLCREYGVSSYEETADGLRLTFGPRIVERPAAEPITDEEKFARRQAEFRRVATMHTRGGR